MAEYTVASMPTTKLIELLSATAADQPYVQIADGQLMLGTDPYRLTSTVDFRAEIVQPLAQKSIAAAAPPRQRRSRGDGKYLVDVKGSITVAHSLHEALATGLRAFEAHQPGTLLKLEKIKPKTKRIVARAARDLFEDPELADNYARPLMAGWWFGINNSNAETIAWLKRGCELAGMIWGKDFSVSL